ncbi:hypothetical protein BDM02DRAFT_3118428 [Thelephora ganbajun]|uniref:Uncharacterized protein n=1 Tax=Thelephora ganbajun TaxID=370292 RepID=A0ACB6ZA45_THEGA|nr:hypothetical protein BDM02DRAFT_3118428 [Thelephora ganbajun]
MRFLDENAVVHKSPPFSRSRPGSGGVRHGPEHAKSVFHITGFQTQNTLHGDQNVPCYQSQLRGRIIRPGYSPTSDWDFRAFGALERVSNDTSTGLVHTAFPLHSVRVEKSHLFCGG